MPGPVRDRSAMIAGMAPARQPGIWVFVTGPAPAHPSAIATMREAEGLSQVLPLDEARRLGLDTSLPMAQITLTVHSALDGVGLTAAVSGALADAGIPCNMIAGYHHDHLFVPEAQAEAAMAILVARAER